MMKMGVLLEVPGQGKPMVVCHCLQSDKYDVLRTEPT